MRSCNEVSCGEVDSVSILVAGLVAGRTSGNGMSGARKGIQKYSRGPYLHFEKNGAKYKGIASRVRSAMITLSEMTWRTGWLHVYKTALMQRVEEHFK